MSAPHLSLAATRHLPEQPNLEQLRKQAKDLLREYNAGAPTAVAEVHRFERHPSTSTIALNDAQRILARSYGFPSWPKLKAFIDGVNVGRFAEAIKAGDISQVRSMLASRPELIGMDMAANDEHRGLHYAVFARNYDMVRLLMEAGADARKGIFPHRDATSALAIARDRGYSEILFVIEEEERRRREELSCSNAAVSPLQDQISSAIAQGDEATAVRLINADRTLIQACDRDGLTPLHVAARANSLELVSWLLERRANVRKKDPSDLTPLDQAALAADPRNDRADRFPQVAAMLLQHGAVLTVRAAVALGDATRVCQLIEAEPKLLRQINNNGGLLTLAVNHHQLEMVQVLLDLGADVNERLLLEELEEPTESWGMPLWYAALSGDFAISQLLLDRGADPNANVYASGWPLRNAWNHADDSVKNLLLDRGAKPQPYMVAEAHDIEEAKRQLAQIPSEELARELAWSAADHGCPQIVALALAHLNWATDDPRWHWILIQPIRGAGADSLKNEGRFQCLEILLKHGVDPNVGRFNQTALHFAAARHGEIPEKDRVRFAAMLLDYGARLDIRDDLLQSSPMGWACRWGRYELVELLVSRGAAVVEKDAAPWATPQAWAQKMNHSEILALLKTVSPSTWRRKEKPL
jgi:ankyrin repeat protein